MDKKITKAVIDVVGAVSQPKVYSAIKYLNEKMVVRVTRPRFKGKVSGKGENLHMSLVIGRPNYAQREFIKFCKKAGEPFPVKRVQLKITK